LVFTGTYEHTIDTKNRLAIPAEVRSLVQKEVGLDADQPISLVVTLGQGDSLYLYTELGFELRARELKELSTDRRKLNAFRRVFFSLSQPMELDKQGRALLPAELLRRVGLSGEIVLIGADDHLEVRDRAAWRNEVEQTLGELDDLL